MAFQFGLDSVLKHRQRLEDLAQREFAEAQQAVDECLRAIEAMYQRLDQVREEISQLQQRGQPRDIDQVREMDAFIIGHKIRIERQRLHARELLVVAENKQGALMEAARNKKILLKLKERRLSEYRTWLARLEAKELDDQTMLRSARRKR